MRRVLVQVRSNKLHQSYKQPNASITRALPVVLGVPPPMESPRAHRSDDRIDLKSGQVVDE
jgi:hypothetical protein